MAPGSAAKVALLSADPQGLTTYDAFDPESFSITSLINDALVFIDTEGAVRPALATRWKRVSPLELDLELREDVRFHNGEAFDADSVVATFEAHRSPTPSASNRGMLSPIAGATKISSQVVRLTTSFPDAMLLRRLFLSSIYPRSVLEEQGREALYAHPIGTGAYRFVSHTRGREIVLERNHNHWLGQATIDRLTFPLLRRIEWVDRLARGEIDIALNLDAHDRLRAARLGLEVQSRDSANTQWFLLSERGPLASVEVRRALNYAINRRLLVELTAQGFGRPQLGVASEAEQGHVELPPHRYDPDLARSMLRAAGVEEGTVLRGLVSEASTSLYFAVREMLLRVGIALEAEIVTRSDWMSRVVKGNISGSPYQGDFALVALDNPILHSLFHHFILLFGGGPFSLLRSKNYDENFAQAASELDDSSAAQAHADLERYTREQALLLFTVHEDVHVAFRKGYSGVIPRSGHFDTDGLTKLSISDASVGHPLSIEPAASSDARRLLEATSHADGFFLPANANFEQPSSAQLWESLRATEERWRLQGESLIRTAVTLDSARSNLRNVLESTEHVAIVGYTSEGRLLFANRGFSQLFPEDAKFDWLAPTWAPIRARVDETGAWQGAVPKPGGHGRLMLTVTRARDGQDAFAGYVLVFHDFSGEEERIRTQSVRSVVENVPYGLFACDREGKVRDGYSEACLSIFARVGNGVVGRPLTELLEMTARQAGHFTAMYEQIIDDLMPTEVNLGNLPATVSVTGRTYSLSASVIRERLGGVEAVLFTLVDISALLSARKEVDELRGVVEVLGHREHFAGFAHALSRDLRELAGQETNPDFEARARRELHKAKGAFAMFRLDGLAKTIHAIEDRDHLDGRTLLDLDVSLRTLVAKNARLWNIDIDDPRRHRSETLLETLERRVLAASSLEEARTIVSTSADHARRRTFGEMLGPLERLCEQEAERQGKAVRLELDGRETAFPERLAPILQLLPQLVRNSVVHGVEGPDRRAPKATQATLSVRARGLDAGGYEIEVADDGRGIRRSEVIRRALALGATTADAIASMTDAECLDLVFVPGLSTASELTESAGRGVGLDAVRAAVEACRGKVHVRSAPGQGTSFVMRFEP